MRRHRFITKRAYNTLAFMMMSLMAGCAMHPDDHSLSIEWEKFKLWSRETSENTHMFFTDEEYRDEVIKCVNSWFTDVSLALHGNSVTDMAARADEAHKLADWSTQYESMEPYGAWLDTQSDYYEAARTAVERNPDPAAKPPPPQSTKLNLPPPPAKGTVTVRPAQPVLPPPRPQHKIVQTKASTPELERRRQQTAVDPSLWREKIAHRPMPARANTLLPTMRAAFEKEGLPPELVWIAEVESTFNPTARSPAGAVGLFQLMPATARSLGITTSNPDQRLDPAANSAAAARYLRYLHGRFDDWPLVFAAYNGGEGRVAGMLRRQNATTYSQISSSLPLETRMYVPRVVETIRLRTGRDYGKM